MSIARNAGKVAFSDFEVQPFAERSCGPSNAGILVKLPLLISRRNPLGGSRVSIAQNAGKVTFSDFEAQPLRRLRGPSCEMLVKLRLLISNCNPLRRSRVSIARNAGKVAFSDFEVQPSAVIVRVHRAKRW